MISAEELAFVRLAMRKRLLQANEVREAVERKKWDAPDRSLRSILVDMGVLLNNQVVELNEEIRDGKRGPGGKRPHTTMVGKDARARETEEELDRSTIPTSLGNYKLNKLLGAGAMGAVYAARNVELERDVALKLLLTEGAPSPRAVQRFKREARLAARLDHPNVVRVYEAGMDKGYHYIAMDMVKGSSVAELITLGEMSPRRAVHVMRKVAEAVGYAHEQEVIHRDLKPANILVDEATGEARVTDFGLAVLSEGGEDDRLTRTGAAVGTPAYMAPEQVRGQLDKIDARTDVYALGSTFYEMLTGQPPFEAPTFLELAKKICDVDPVSPRKRNRDVPVDAETICMKALEKRKESRYQTAYEMAQDLAAFLRDDVIVAQRPSLAVRAGRWARRRPALVAGAVGFLAVFLGALGVYLTLPGTLEIAIKQPGAQVFVDQEQVGTTTGDPDNPLRVELSAGTHEMSFRLKGYLKQALGIPPVVRIGHGGTHRVSGTLVSTSGLLSVETEPSGAKVRVFLGGGSDPVAAGTSNWVHKLPAGTYRIELDAPGCLPRTLEGIEIDPGGDQQVSEKLQLDSAKVTVEADPEDLTLSRDGRTYEGGADLPGRGDHTIVARKPGYLPRRLRVTVPAGKTLRRRVTLAPLLAFRRPLRGELRGQPLIRDVDGDGALDLVVLEQAAKGSRLTVLPGRGHTQAPYRVPTTATRLVDAIDLNTDGVLDILLGDRTRFEARDGRTGKLLNNLALDTWSMRVVRLPNKVPQLIYMAIGGRVEQANLDPSIWKRPLSPSRRRGRRPALIELSRRLKVVFARRGELRVHDVEARRGSILKVRQVTTTSQLLPVRVLPNRDRWLAVVPRQGRAHIVDPADDATYSLGEPEARFTRAAAVELAEGAWLFLSDAARAGKVRVFQLGRKSAQEADQELQALKAKVGLPVLLQDGGSPLIWTTSGVALRRAKGRWRIDRDLSTGAQAWIRPDVVPLQADLSGDGQAEIVAPSKDRRSLVALTTQARWLRWRGRYSPRRVASGRLSEHGTDLLLAQGTRVIGLSGADGRELFSLELPGTVQHVAASVPLANGGRSDVFASFLAPDRTPRLACYRWSGVGTVYSASWAAPVARRVDGLAPLPLDIDGDKRNDMLVSAPLSLVLAKDGRASWSDGEDRAQEQKVDAGLVTRPRFSGGKTPTCVGARFTRDGLVGLVGFDQRGGDRALWFAPLTHTVTRNVSNQRVKVKVPDPATHLMLEEGQAIFVAATRRRLVALGLSGGQQVWSKLLGAEERVLGGVLRGDRLVVSLSGGRLLGVDAQRGRAMWQVDLPHGPAAASAPLLLRKGQVSEDAVAVVGPSGVLLFFAVQDGAFLGERRYPEGPFLPGITRLPGGKEQKPALVLSTADERLVALELPALRRPQPKIREQVWELRRRVALGDPYLGPALARLRVLNTQTNHPLIQLALSQGHLERGQPEEALQVIQQLLKTARFVEHPPAAALTVKIKATYARDQSPELVEPLLRELRKRSPRRAARVALALGDSGRPANEGWLYQLATKLDPGDPLARRRLGIHQLRTVIRVSDTETRLQNKPLLWRPVNNRWWKAQNDLALLRASNAAATARITLTQALAGTDDPTARAAAIVATVLERTLITELKARGRSITKSRRSLVEKALQALVTGGPPARTTPELLRRARLLAAKLSAYPDVIAQLRKRFELVYPIYVLRPDWSVPLVAITCLR